MPKLGINTGNSPNDGQGDPLRVAMGKINSNFTELYNTLGNGTTLASYVSTAGVATLAQNLTGNPRINVSGVSNTGITTTEHIEVRNITSTGVITATQFVGDGSQLTNVTALVGGLEVLDDDVRKGVARELNFGENIISSGPDAVGRVTISVPTINLSQFSVVAGLSTVSTYSTIAGYANTAGIATVARGLTGTPNINVGVATASSFIRSGGTSNQFLKADGSIDSSTYLTTVGTANSAVSSRVAYGLLGTPNINAGVVTGTTFYGSGSSLTGLTGAAANTYGNETSTPQIVVDSTGRITSITNVLITGAGGGGGNGNLIIYDDALPIGTAGTINFGQGLSVSSLSAGIVTVTSVSTGYAVTAGIATYATTSGISTYSVTAGITTYSTSAGISSTLIPTASVNTSGIITASSFVGNLTGNVTGNFSGTVIGNATGLSGNPSITVTNLFVGGTLSVAGTSVVLNSATLQIKNRVAILGFTTDANNQDISSDVTANNGGISVASTIGTPLISIPIQSGVNSSPFTYKQFIWARSGYYSGLGTDAWISNYAISIGNTSKVLVNSRFTVGLGFTVYDTYLDAQDIRIKNINVSGISTFSEITTHTAPLLGTQASFSGVVTAFSFSGNASSANYAPLSGVSTYAISSGIATYAWNSGVSTYSSSSGISTFSGYSNYAGISTTAGYATTAGIATLAGYASTSGIATYSPIAGISTVAGYATTAGISTIATYALTAGIATYATSSGVATVAGYALISGISTYSSSTGIATVAGYASTSGIATYASSSGISTYATRSGIATYATTAGIATLAGYATTAGIATYATTAGISTYATTAGIATYATSAGISTYATSAGISTYATNAGIATYTPTAGVSTVSQGLTGTPNINIGITTSQILNVGTAGTIITTTSSGLVGIGSTNPTSKLSVIGDAYITGVVTASSFVGNLSGSVTNATNLTGGIATASQLLVSGVTTISTGRIQADAASNLRFGNLPAGSGSSGRNIAIGDQVLVTLSGGSGRNIGIGELSYYDTTSGQYNIGLGIQAGQKITTGSYNVIIGGYNGQTGLDLRTSSNNVVIADGQGNIRQYINSSGNVGIKTTVVTEALTVAGVVSATSFYGTLNAGQLTGALPAIDGSALINVVASGAGVQIRSNNTPVGTAGTINFGSYLNVSFVSGIATITGTGIATYANLSGVSTYATTAGVSTTSNTATYAITAGVSTTSGTSGYATTAGISSAVSTTININTSGIVTASSFSGSGSGLTNLPAGQLTGTLPAIDGSALLNVNASGSGIVVLDENVNIGTAKTVNFGTGLDVTYSVSGIATINASGGSLKSRTVVTGVTTSIANNGIGNTNITGYKSYSLLKVGLSTAAWLRIYTDSASRANDVNRSVGIDPTPGSGVIAEVVTTGLSTTQIISPFVMGGNLDEPASTTIYAAVTNLSGVTTSISVNLTVLQLEA